MRALVSAVEILDRGNIGRKGLLL